MRNFVILLCTLKVVVKYHRVTQINDFTCVMKQEKENGTIPSNSEDRSDRERRKKDKKKRKERKERSDEYPDDDQDDSREKKRTSKTQSPAAR